MTTIRQWVAAGCAIALAAVGLARLHPALGAAFVAAATALAARGGRWRPGLAALPAFLAALPTPLPPAPLPDGGPARVDGLVRAVRCDREADAVDLTLAAPGGLVRLRIAPRCPVLPGDRVIATARCTPPAVPDGRAALHAHAGACRIEAGGPSLPRVCTALRLTLEDRLYDLLPPEDAALVCTLVLGAGTRVTSELAAAHRATGLSHLLAVSGAHAAMLAMLLGLQPFLGGRRRRVGRTHLIAALAILALYGAITGFEPPVFRALASYLLAAIGTRTGRRLGLAAGLAWPALLSCLVTPDGVLGASFCLSYAAVFGLWLAGPARSDQRLERFVLAPMRASFWASACTAPFTLGWFGQFAPWTVLLTPVLAPLVAALLFLGLFAAVGSCLVPGIGSTLGPLLQCCATVYVHAVQFADGLPATPVHAWVTPPPFLLALGAAAGAVLLAVRRTRGAALGACALASLPHFLPPDAPDEPSLTVFAVGHGQCCLVQFRDHANIVLDCGSLQHQSLPARRLERALRRRRIDLLVLTHADQDHVGSVPVLVHSVPILRAVLPAALRSHPAAQALAMQGCEIRWLVPGERCEPMPGIAVAAPIDPGPRPNDASLWTLVDLDGLRVELPGDAQQRGIEAALAQGLAAPADVLVLPHHGRPEVAIDALFAAVAPRLCLVSNRSGEGISVQGGTALRHGVPTLATGDSGTLQVFGGPRPWIDTGLGLRVPARVPPEAR